MCPSLPFDKGENEENAGSKAEYRCAIAETCAARQRLQPRAEKCPLTPQSRNLSATFSVPSAQWGRHYIHLDGLQNVEYDEVQRCADLISPETTNLPRL